MPEELAFPKMYPGAWPNHPVLPQEHEDEIGLLQAPAADLRANVMLIGM
jgi:hypothetical protein